MSRDTGNEFDGSDFSNNLFSDLAPLLTLFGEQVTKQFLSQSIGYGDDILLAMVPLGIITCIVSAIRVGGKRWLKALVGRARESQAVAEMEIMSSTSDAVCELWSGVEIVRERGRPRTKEFIYRRVTDQADLTKILNSKIVYDLRTACEEGVLTAKQSAHAKPGPWYRRPRTEQPRKTSRDRDVECATRLLQQAPNLTLNVTVAMTSPAKTWGFAFLGVVLQLGVFAIAAMVTYHWQMGGGSSAGVVGYGFPLFMAGSILLCCGIFLCSYIIESVTEEIDFVEIIPDKNIMVLRIQGACTVGDQRFGSYAIRNEEGNTTIRTSRIQGNPDLSFLSMGATCLSLSGYIMQFVGLRAMHWSVAITVLGATLIMAGIRAYVRRGIAATPQAVELKEGGELSWLVMEALSLESFGLGIPESDQSTQAAASSPALASSPQTSASIIAQKAVEVRQELTDLASWQDEHTALAHELAEAITGTLQYVMSNAAFELDTTATIVKVLGRRIDRSRRRDDQEVPYGQDASNPLQTILNAVFADFEGILEEETFRLPDQLAQAEGRVNREGSDTGHNPISPSGPPAQSNVPTTGESPHGEYPSTSCTSDLGFTFHLVDPANAELSFAWEADIRLTGPSIGGSQIAKVRFSARRAVHDFESRGPRDLADQPIEPEAWMVDTGRLAAFLSLCASTMERQHKRFPSSFDFRVLGCGWDVLVPAHPVASHQVTDAKKVRSWLNGKAGDSATESLDPPNTTVTAVDAESHDLELPLEKGPRNTADSKEIIPRAPKNETGSSGPPNVDGSMNTPCIAKALPALQTYPGFRTVDFYEVWIERGLPSGSSVSMGSLVESLWGNRTSGADPRPRPKDSEYMFGVAFAFYSRKLRREALLYRSTRADHTLSTRVPNSPARNSSTETGQSPSGGSGHPMPPFNRASTMLAYMFPPDGIVPDDKAAQDVLLDTFRMVVIQSSASRLCAQEIFSSFLLGLVSCIKSVRGGARPRSPVWSDEEGTLRWHHPALSQLAEIVYKTRLVNSLEEAFTLIIPAFHAYGLLPTWMETGGSEGSDYIYPSHDSCYVDESYKSGSRVGSSQDKETI